MASSHLRSVLLVSPALENPTSVNSLPSTTTCLTSIPSKCSTTSTTGRTRRRPISSKSRLLWRLQMKRQTRKIKLKIWRKRSKIRKLLRRVPIVEHKRKLSWARTTTLQVMRATGRFNSLRQTLRATQLIQPRCFISSLSTRSNLNSLNKTTHSQMTRLSNCQSRHRSTTN